MGTDKQSSLEVRVIEETTKQGTKTYKLHLTDPSTLEYAWFLVKDTKETVVGRDKARNLWKEYNPRLKEKINQFRKYMQEGAFLEEIANVLEIDYTTARSLKNTTVKQYKVERLLKVKGPRRQGPWYSFPIDLVAYILSYYMPIIEGWKTSYDISKENNVSVSTINNLCAEPQIEAIIRAKRWYISPLGEQVIAERLTKRRERTYVLRKEGKDYYSIVYAGREATRLRGFIEGTEAFEIESERRYKIIKYILSHCSVINSEIIEGSPYVDKKNLDLLCDIISRGEASNIIGISEKEINLMIKDGVLPTIPSDKGYFTLMSAVLKLKCKEEEKPISSAEELSTKYQSLLETNKSLTASLEQTAQKLEQAQSKISSLKAQISSHESAKPTQEQLEKYAQLESKVTILEQETQSQKETIGQLEKANKDLQAELAEAKTYKTVAQQLESRVKELQTEVEELQKYKQKAEQLQEKIKTFETNIANLKKEKEALQQSNQEIEQLQLEIANLERGSKEQKTQSEGTIQTLNTQLEEAKTTIYEQRQVLEELEREVTHWRSRYQNETREYFANLSKAVDMLDQALSEGKVPQKNEQLTALLVYLNQAKHFQPNTVPLDSDYTLALNAKASTTLELTDIVSLTQKWLKTGDKRYINPIRVYFSALSTEFQERMGEK